jgi:hypothetical protein
MLLTATTSYSSCSTRQIDSWVEVSEPKARPTLCDDVNRLVRPDAAKITVDMFLELSPTLNYEFVKVKDERHCLPTLIALCQNRCKRRRAFLPTKQLAHEASLLSNSAGMKAAELHAICRRPRGRNP